MDAEYKAKWLEALRSGRYAQADGELRNKTGFCCLGVLCDLVDPNGWEPTARRMEWRGRKEWLPLDMRKALGLDNWSEGKTARLNDEGKSFPEIADWIEANL